MRFRRPLVGTRAGIGNKRTVARSPRRCRAQRRALHRPHGRGATKARAYLRDDLVRVGLVWPARMEQLAVAPHGVGRVVVARVAQVEVRVLQVERPRLQSIIYCCYYYYYYMISIMITI